MTIEETGKDGNGPGEDSPMLESKPESSSQPEQVEESNKLKRELGLLDGASIIIGIIVGSGIFVSPKGVLLHAGSVGMSLVIWTLSGVLSMVGALCYAELGTMIPKSGGDYAYIHEAFGPLPAFLYLWMALIVIMPAGNAIIALTFANYILQPIYPECDPPIDAVRLLAACVICLLTAINCYKVKSATMVQDLFTGAKVFALVIVIIAGIVWLGFGHTEQLEDPMRNTDWSPGHLSLSFYSGLFSYAGWNYLNFVTEELKEPNTNLPRAIYISMPLVTVTYLLANLAYFAVLTPEEILASNAVAVTFGNRLLGVMSWVMPFFVACSTFGAVNGGIFASSRLFFVGARGGHMPSFMALVNTKNHTPMPCLIFLGLLTLAMLTTDDVYELINYTSFVESSFIGVSVAGLLWLRYKQPNLERPIKVNLLLPIGFLIVCLFLIVLPVLVTPKLVGVDLALLVSGIPVYLFFIRWRTKPAWLNKIIHSMDSAVQKLFFCIPTEE